MKSNEPNVGRLIHAIRLRRGLSQSVVCRRAGIDPSYLSRIEHGKINPTVALVLRISRGLGVSPSELLGTQPDRRRDGPCPASVTGQCLLDLIGPEAEADPEQGRERYTARQLRLVRQFASLIGKGDGGLQEALEVLFERIQAAGRPEAGSD